MNSTASKRLDAMDAFELTATFNACASAKSLLIGLALVRGAITVEEATRAARAEEDFQTEEWGLVEGGHDVDAADVSVRLRAPRAMMSLLRVVR
jgi:ATP synthase F1 complex assembly factor 2